MSFVTTCKWLALMLVKAGYGRFCSNAGCSNFYWPWACQDSFREPEKLLFTKFYLLIFTTFY